jgi:hypothetical protein
VTYVRWLTGTVLVAFFVLTLVCNLALVLGWVFGQKRSSLALIAGGIAGLGGFLILPIPILNAWFWVPIAADIGVPYGVGLVLLGSRKLYRLRSPSRKIKS